MSSVKEMQRVDRELFLEVIENPVNPAFLHMFDKKISHYRQTVYGLLCSRFVAFFSNQENFSRVNKQRECETSDPRIALRSSHSFFIFLFFALFIFLTWRRIPCLRQKVNDRGKIHLIISKPAAFYNLLRVSAVLFCVLSTTSRISHLKKKTPLSQVKLFKPPAVRGTISIIQKTFLSTRFG